MVGYFQEGGGDHSGSSYYSNTISSSENGLAFGIMIGFHPWDPDQPVNNAGEVTGNDSSGAVVNLAIDGPSDGTVSDNSVSNARGTHGFNCSISSDYTAIHYGSTSIQSSPTPVSRHYHPGGCGS
jgi:hypothetical protein